MATFEFFNPQTDKQTQSDTLSMLVDVVGDDVSSSATRRKYQVWVSGSGTGAGVTSSLFQTVFDQDFSLNTANPVFDITVGVHTSSGIVQNNLSVITYDSVNDQYYFPSYSCMMREKIDIYRSFAQQLLGDDSRVFTFFSGALNGTPITDAVFLSYKRLFTRDQLKRETYVLRMFGSGSQGVNAGDLWLPGTVERIYTDQGSAANVNYSFPGGSVGTLIDTSTTSSVGLIWHDQGIAVLDVSRIMNVTQSFSGTIASINTPEEPFTGSILTSTELGNNTLFWSASIDDIVDHICTTRFTGSEASVTAFQNQTNINSSVYFCKLEADRFNYSSNPTYTDSTGRIVVIDPGQEDVQRSFSFITGVGLYDADNNLLAVAKMSRPILKNFQRSFSIKIRLDF